MYFIVNNFLKHLLIKFVESPLPQNIDEYFKFQEHNHLPFTINKIMEESVF